MHPCFFILTLTLLAFLQIPTAFAAMAITGTVSEKLANSVKVEFKPHKTAVPKIGDLVDFKKIIKGFDVNAGQGEVTEIGEYFAWVKIEKGRPGLKMTGIITATGTLSAVSKGRRDETIQGKEVDRSKQKKTLKPKDVLTNELTQTQSISPDSSKIVDKVRSKSVQKLRIDKIYVRKDSPFYHNYWCKEISGMHYDSLIMFDSISDAVRSGGLPCKACKIYVKKDSRFYHRYWCKEIAGIDYDSLIMFSSVDDAKESGGLPCKKCNP